MITIHIPASDAKDYWDPKKEEFVTVPATKAYDLMLEHSLISISKWEAKWHVPFISKEKRTEEQTIYYIKCMTINSGVPDSAYEHLTSDDIIKISDYINDPMTATTVAEDHGKGNREVVTSELIYYWMTALQIPFECEKWHLNRLLKLIAVCNAKNTPPKKMGKNEIMQRNKALNAARRAKYNSKG
jgi:hypothetical protein